MCYFFAIIGMEAFRYQVYPQCWYGYRHVNSYIITLVDIPEEAKRLNYI